MLKSPIKASFIPISGFSDTFKQKKNVKKTIIYSVKFLPEIL